MLKQYNTHVLGLFAVSRADRPAEAGAVQEGVGAAGAADQTRDPQQPEL